jgi:ABC-2 type transport system permease protein
MMRYLGVTRNAMMCGFTYRLQFISSLLGNLVLIVVTYFLWRSIYDHASPTLAGMSFEQTFAYLALAAALASIFRTWMEWDMSRAIVNGSVVMTLAKPIDYQTYLFFQNLGAVINNFATLALPSIVFVVAVFGIHLDLGVNIPFFAVAVVLAGCIAFTIDYAVGLMSFYTEIIWGLSTAKDVIVMLCSGMVIPLGFYPADLRRVLEWLPFRAIYDVPLTILTSRGMTVAECGHLLGLQLAWALAGTLAVKMLYRCAIRVVTVNGG